MRIFLVNDSRALATKLVSLFVTRAGPVVKEAPLSPFIFQSADRKATLAQFEMARQAPDPRGTVEKAAES